MENNPLAHNTESDLIFQRSRLIDASNKLDEVRDIFESCGDYDDYCALLDVIKDLIFREQMWIDTCIEKKLCEQDSQP